MKNGFKAFFKSWEVFWFSKGGGYQISLFRFLFCTVLTVFYGIRLGRVDLFFTSKGYFNPEQAVSFFSELFPTWFHFFIHNDSVMQVHAVLHWVGLLALALGLIGRWGTWIVFLLHVGLLQRNHAAAYGVDTVSVFFLFYLSLCRHDRYFTLIKKTGALGMDQLTSIGYRFLQIQLCVVYAYSGLEKMRGPSWWDGSAMWQVLGNASLVPFDFGFLVHVPWLVALMTFATVFFEIYFPFAVLLKQSRKTFLLIGLFIHLGIGILMGLYSFSLVMVCAYVLFLDNFQLGTLQERLQRIGQPGVGPSWLRRVSTFSGV